MNNIREAAASDLPQIVSLHELCFPGFLMTLLGGAFLHVYYKICLKSPGTLVLIAEEEGKTLGFAVGHLAPSRFYTLLRDQWWLLSCTAARGALRSPNLLARILGSLRRMNRAAACGAGHELGVELASIGVLPDASRKGVGTALISAFAERARASGADYIYLATDAENNEKANSFYRGLMFARAGTFLSSGGRLMNEYVSPLRGEFGRRSSGSANGLASSRTA